MKPRCLLIAPTKYFYKEVRPESVKYHLLTLMSHLLDLADVEVIDLEMQFGYPQSEAAITDVLARTEALLADRRVDVVGVSCYTSYDYLASVDVLRLCDRLLPGAIKVVGGYHATAVPEDFLRLDVPVDYVVRGEGEGALRRLLQEGRLPEGPVVQGPVLDLAHEEPLRYDLYPYRAEDITLGLSRGCPFRCTFCVQSDDFPNGYRALPPALVIEKIERVCRFTPVRRIMFVDPYFGVQRAQTAALLELLAARFPDLYYWAETRVDTAHPDWLDELRSLKFDLHLGVESLAPDTLRLMRKAPRPESYIERFHQTMALCQEREILARCGFIMNYPGELPESYQATLSHLRRAADAHHPVGFTFHCNQYALYPGNHIYQRRHELAAERGFRFQADGWWRVRAPNIRKRAEVCSASAALDAAWGGDHTAWTRDVRDLLKHFSARYSFRAFSYFRRDEILDSLRAHYPDRSIQDWDDDVVAVQAGLLRRLRFLTRDVYFRYEEWLRPLGEASVEALLRLFNLVVFQAQRRLLSRYDAGEAPTVLDHAVDTICEALRQEQEHNLARTPAVTPGPVGLTLLGERYRIDAGGRTFRAGAPRAAEGAA